MSVESRPDLHDFADFAENLHDQRVRNEEVVRQALRRACDRYPDNFLHELSEVSRAIDGTLGDLDHAAEELRVQNEALFAARTELEGTSALFRDLFELAPSAYVVTNNDPRFQILYANHAASALLGLRKNALAGKALICFVPPDERDAFRSAVLRITPPGGISEWPATLVRSDAAALINCRMRIRAVSAAGECTPRALYWNITEETDEDLF
jgi:PAS domain-containing protein